MDFGQEADQVAELGVDLYDTIHRGNPGDVGFYAGLSRGPKKVLEFGVGTGRIALALARLGAEVVGVDCDEGMLARAQSRLAQEPASVRQRVELIAADMCTVALGRRFDLVVIPYNALLCLLHVAETRRCFLNARHHLAVGGRFAFDVYRADALHGSDEEDDKEHNAFLFDEEPLVQVEQQGRSLHVLEANRWIRDAQRMDTAYRFRLPSGEILYEQCIRQRYLLVRELQELLAETGFRVLQHQGGFGGEPCCEDALHHVVVAEPSAELRAL